MADVATIDSDASDAVASAAPNVQRLRRRYLDFVETKRAEREESREAEHYYHADQWTAADRAVLAKRKQPIVTYNRIKRKIDGVVGVVIRLRQDPKAFPRTPVHEVGAETGTAALRYALDRADWENVEPETARRAAITGIGCVALELDTSPDGDVEVRVDLVEDGFFYDPRSIRADFSDSRDFGIAKWVSVEEAQDLFPELADRLGDLVTSGGGDSSGLEETDRDHAWVNIKRRRLRLIEHWYKVRGEWQYCFYVGDTVLESGVSPFRDKHGNTFSRFVPWSAYVDHDGDRYGFIRELKGPQDELNMRHSKGLHILNTRRIVADKGAVDDVERARTEAARPDGFLEKNPGRDFDFDDSAKHADLSGQIRMLEKAEETIETFGPNSSLIGQGNESQSGRAIALLQQAGLAELGPFLRAYRAFKIRVYRAVWAIIQQHWTSEKWIRVTDSEDVAQFMQINALEVDEFGQPVISNYLGDLDVDIILDEGPDTTNTMADTFELLQSLAASGVQIPPEVVIELSGLPDSQKQRILGMLQPPPPEPDPMDEQAAMLDMESRSLDNQKTAAETTKLDAEARAKRAQTVLDVMRASMAGPMPMSPGML
jgi:hypothetical protein